MTLIFQQLKDLDLYTDDRYAYATEIGRCWLATLASLTEDKVKLIEEVAKENTLVGEYCGHTKMQHLVKYDKESIIFYAVVPKDCSVPCWPMKRTYRFFDDSGLEKVTMDVVEGVKTIGELADAVSVMNAKVAGSSVAEEGEGSVLYIERCNPATGEGEVLSLCKLKTMEYRFLRKAREKLKSSLKQKVYAPAKILDKFVSECHTLVDDYPEDVKAKLPDINEYKVFLETAMKIAKTHGIHYEVIEKCFINVIELVNKCMKEKREPTESEISQINAYKPSAEDSDGCETTVNIVLIDIPGMLDTRSLMEDLKSRDYRIRFEYGDKRCAMKTFRFVNVAKDSINIKSMKPFTYLIVPDLASIEDQTAFKKSCVARLTSLFDSKPSAGSDLESYLKSAANNISKQTNLDTIVELSLLKISRIKDISNKHVLRCGNGDWQSAVIKEISQIEKYHAANHTSKSPIDSDIEE